MDQQVHRKKSLGTIIKKITGFILLLLMAAVFLFSGFSKLLPSSSFEQFTWNIMDAGASDVGFASVMARLFIGAEILLGLFLLCHLFLRSFTYPSAIAVLVVFTIYLLFLINRYGNDGDCGCFGDAYKMKPSLAIIKNLVMIAVLLLLMKIYPFRSYKNNEWVGAIAGIGAFVIPFIFHPLNNDRRPEAVNEPANLTPLYASENPKNIPPQVNLRQGKHIIAFLSLTCHHCRKAAFELQVIHKQHPEFPIYMVLNGNPDFLQDFFKETRASVLPYTLFSGPEEFMSMSGPGVPAIYWVNNGIIEYQSNYYQLNPEFMAKWLIVR